MGATQPPEISAILEQVTTELIAMRLAGEVGSVTVDVGPDQMVVKANAVRKYDPVLVDRSRMNVIRRPR